MNLLTNRFSSFNQWHFAATVCVVTAVTIKAAKDSAEFRAED